MIDLNEKLANTDFTAEKINLKIVPLTYQNPFLLTDEKLQETQQKQQEFSNRLAIPKRPFWDATTTKHELEEKEKSSFLEWRRGLVMLEEDEGLLMTPYERNIQVWRQLWRVIERSHLIVQIVDARDPLLFRCADLEMYSQLTSFLMTIFFTYLNLFNIIQSLSHTIYMHTDYYY